MRRLALLLLLPLLAGCVSPAGAIPPLYQVTDWELQLLGEWTATDAEARRLIGSEWGALDYRPVRLGSNARKLLCPVSSLLGWNYEKRYHYNPDAKKYVLLRQGGPAVIVDEAWGGGADEDQPSDTPPEAFEMLRGQIERDLQALFPPERVPALEP